MGYHRYGLRQAKTGPGSTVLKPFKCDFLSAKTSRPKPRSYQWFLPYLVRVLKLIASYIGIYIYPSTFLLPLTPLPTLHSYIESMFITFHLLEEGLTRWFVECYQRWNQLFLLPLPRCSQSQTPKHIQFLVEPKTPPVSPGPRNNQRGT